MHPERVNQYLREILAQHLTSLERGTVMSVSEGQIRLRQLPLQPEDQHLISAH